MSMSQQYWKTEAINVGLRFENSERIECDQKDSTFVVGWRSGTTNYDESGPYNSK